MPFCFRYLIFIVKVHLALRKVLAIDIDMPMKRPYVRLARFMPLEADDRREGKSVGGADERKGKSVAGGSTDERPESVSDAGGADSGREEDVGPDGRGSPKGSENVVVSGEPGASGSGIVGYGVAAVEEDVEGPEAGTSKSLNVSGGFADDDCDTDIYASDDHRPYTVSQSDLENASSIGDDDEAIPEKAKKVVKLNPAQRREKRLARKRERYALKRRLEGKEYIPKSSRALVAQSSKRPAKVYSSNIKSVQSLRRYHRAKARKAVAMGTENPDLEALALGAGRSELADPARLTEDCENAEPEYFRLSDRKERVSAEALLQNFQKSIEPVVSKNLRLYFLRVELMKIRDAMLEQGASVVRKRLVAREQTDCDSSKDEFAGAYVYKGRAEAAKPVRKRTASRVQKQCL